MWWSLVCSSWPGLSRPSTSLTSQERKTWMPGTSPGMTKKKSQSHLPGREVFHDFLAAAADGVDLDLAINPLLSNAAHKTGTSEDLHRFGSAERHGLRGLV